jgi:hypothetical protein
MGMDDLQNFPFDFPFERGEVFTQKISKDGPLVQGYYWPTSMFW